VTSKKDNPVSGISVYQQKGRKTWSYRLELDRHPLTDERQFEYGHGFSADEDALTAAIKAKAAHKAVTASSRPSSRWAGSSTSG
jgi:hypothetical protein